VATNQNKIHVMQLVAALEFGGAERLAATICSSLPKGRFITSICGFMGKEGALVEDLRHNGIPYFYLDAAHVDKMGLLLKLYRLLRDQKVDIIQIHGAYSLLNCFLSAKLAGIKIVYTEHAKQTISEHSLARFAAKFFSYGTKKVVCVSENLRTFFLEKLGVADARIQVIHNGIDVDRFQMDQLSFSENRSKQVIGCIARLTEAKDHANLLEAFSLIVRKFKRVRLVLVGEGEMRRDIERKIDALGLSATVELLGNRNDIPDLLAGMDIFVLPSKREGFPVSILEAMAAGRPVVSTDVGGVSEVIVSGENGIIVPPANAEALADALLKLLNAPDMCRVMGSEGQLTVRTSFSVESMMNSYSSLFDNI